MTASMLLAAEDSNKAGPIGLLVIILLAIACYFLYRSMSRHLRRVREQFPDDESPTGDPTTSQLPATSQSAAASQEAAPPEVDTSTTAPGTHVDVSTQEAPEPRRAPFVPPVRPTHAVPRTGDPRPDPPQQ